MSKKIHWLLVPEEHNYPAAESYLTLVIDDDYIEEVIDELRENKVQYFKAKDIFRASKLSLLGISNTHVEKNQKKIENETELSPLLIVKDVNMRTLIVADGYHRLCAVYLHDEDATIPCKLTFIHY